PRTTRPPTSTLFPYTTLFRSPPGKTSGGFVGSDLLILVGIELLQQDGGQEEARAECVPAGWRIAGVGHVIEGETFGFTGKLFNRSEEHTSELQSLRHLVCRLL